MAGKFYERLHQRLRDLVAQGTKVADPASGTRAARIHKWINEAEEHLKSSADQTFLLEFRVLQRSQDSGSPAFQRIVNDDEADSHSPSAYWVAEPDAFLDFRFDLLAKVNDLLKAAATKLEIAGHSVPTLGEQLREAREQAGHTQEEAAAQISEECDHKYISEWEAGIRRPGVKLSKKIREYIKTTKTA
jgi:DNA-binding XRE family transcriptional regulator